MDTKTKKKIAASLRAAAHKLIGSVVSAEFREEVIREVMSKHLPNLLGPAVIQPFEALPEQLDLPGDLTRAADAFDLAVTDLLAEVAGEQEAQSAMDKGASAVLFDYLDGSGSISDLRNKGIEDYAAVDDGIRGVAYEFRELRNLIDQTLKEGIFAQIEDWASNAADKIDAAVEEADTDLPTGEAAKAMYLTAVPGNDYGEDWQRKGKKLSFAQAVAADMQKSLADWAAETIEDEYLLPGQVDIDILSSVVDAALFDGAPEAKVLAAIEKAAEVVLAESWPKGQVLTSRLVKGDIVTEIDVDVEVPSATGSITMANLVRLMNDPVFKKHLSKKAFMRDSRLLDMKPGQKTVQVWANGALDNHSFYVIVDANKVAKDLGVESFLPEPEED